MQTSCGSCASVTLCAMWPLRLGVGQERPDAADDGGDCWSTSLEAACEQRRLRLAKHQKKIPRQPEKADRSEEDHPELRALAKHADDPAEPAEGGERHQENGVEHG